jgi:DNA-binding SARP family transcriptional activator
VTTAAPSTPIEPDRAGPELDLSVLGPLRARRDGKEAGLGGRRQQAVLARLLLAGGDVVSADRLVDDLWAGEPPASATNTLQSYVSNLRRILGPSDPPIIERAGEGYRLRLDEGAARSVRFEQLVASSASASDPSRTVALLDEGLALWEGPALADFADEEWAVGDAVRLDELRLAATEARFQAQLDLGAHALVVGDLDAAVREHPLRERLTELLVLALYRCGRQAEALRAYERTRRHLGDELGLDPGPDLADLANRVAAQDPSLAAPEAPARIEEPAAGPAGHGGRPDKPPPTGIIASQVLVPLPPAVAERRSRSGFVGRSAELAALEDAWEAASSVGGEAGVVTLTGEPGAGKTRLAQHFAHQVFESGGRVLWGRCGAENLVAYQPVLEACRTAFRSLGPEVVDAALATWPGLRRLLPDLGAPDAEQEGRAERYELFEAAAGLVRSVTSGAPMLLVIDDLQWVDTATLSMLDHLLHHTDGRFLVIGTLRRPAGRPTQELDRFLTDLRRSRRVDHVDVGGFAPDEVAELLAGRGVEVSGRQAAEVCSRTGGNPFFVEALAEGGQDLATGDARDVPDSVREVLDQRVAALDAAATRVLTAAAVVGLRVDLDLLAEVVGVDLDAVLDVVDAAVEVGLLAEDEELGRVTFPHALVRQALVARIGRNREALLHLKIADAIEAGPPTVDQATTVAQHLLSAGRACPPARVADAAIAAGRAAMLVVADDEALIWGQRTMAALSGTADTKELALRRVLGLLMIARAHRHLGDLDAARPLVDQALELAKRHHEPYGMSRAAEEYALLAGGVGFTFSGLDDVLLGLLDAALAMLDAVPEAEREVRNVEWLEERAAMLAWSSIALNGGDDRDTQERLSIEAMEAAEAVPGKRHVRALALFARRVAVGGSPGLDERLALAAPLREWAVGWTEMEVVARAFEVIDLLEADRVDESRAVLELLREEVAPIGRPALDTYVAFFDAMFAMLDGDLDRAEERSHHALEIGTAAHGENAATAWAGQQFMLAREHGRLSELAGELQRLADAEPLVPAWRIGLAWALADGGDLDGARANAAGYITPGGLSVDRRSVLRGFVSGIAAEVAWLTWDAPLAEAVVVELAPISHRVGGAGLAATPVGHLVRYQGMALAVSGDLDAGEAQLEVAADRARACGFGPELARALANRAAVLERRNAAGDADLAAALRTEAEAVAADLGVVLRDPPPA